MIDESGLSDAHMIVLAMLRDESVNTIEDAAAALGVAPAVIRPLVSDLEAAGLLEPVAIN